MPESKYPSDGGFDRFYESIRTGDRDCNVEPRSIGRSIGPFALPDIRLLLSQNEFGFDFRD